jgi:hypothetical protein
MNFFPSEVPYSDGYRELLGTTKPPMNEVNRKLDDRNLLQVGQWLEQIRGAKSDKEKALLRSQLIDWVGRRDFNSGFLLELLKENGVEEFDFNEKTTPTQVVDALLDPTNLYRISIEKELETTDSEPEKDKEIKLNLVYVDAVLVPSDRSGIEVGSGKGIDKRKRVLPRTSILVRILKENGIKPTDYQILVGKIPSDMLIERSYKMFLLPDLKKMVLVSNEYKNATFVVHEYSGSPQNYYSLSKKDLSTLHPLVQRIVWNDVDWEDKILEALTREVKVNSQAELWCQDFLRGLDQKQLARLPKNLYKEFLEKHTDINKDGFALSDFVLVLCRVRVEKGVVLRRTRIGIAGEVQVFLAKLSLEELKMSAQELRRRFLTEMHHRDNEYGTQAFSAQLTSARSKAGLELHVVKPEISQKVRKFLEGFSVEELGQQAGDLDKLYKKFLQQTGHDAEDYGFAAFRTTFLRFRKSVDSGFALASEKIKIKRQEANTKLIEFFSRLNHDELVLDTEDLYKRFLAESKIDIEGYVSFDQEWFRDKLYLERKKKGVVRAINNEAAARAGNFVLGSTLFLVPRVRREQITALYREFLISEQGKTTSDEYPESAFINIFYGRRKALDKLPHRKNRPEIVDAVKKFIGSLSRGEVEKTRAIDLYHRFLDSTDFTRKDYSYAAFRQILVREMESQG